MFLVEYIPTPGRLRNTMQPDPSQVEYHVDRGSSDTFVSGDFKAAVVVAMTEAIARGESTLDVVICSEAGALAFGGDDAADRYREDPEASVFERYEIRVNNAGRVP